MLAHPFKDRFGFQARFLRPFLDHLVDQAEVLCHLRRQEHIALEGILDLLERLAGMPDINLVEPALEVQDFLGVEHDVGRLALEPARGLVHHDARIRQRKAHVLGARGEQERAHGGRLPGAKGRNLRPDELHRVVDRQARGDDAARRIDVNRDFFLRIVGLEEQELGDDEGGHAILDRAGDEDDPLLEKPRIDVVGPFPAVGLLDHHGNEVLHVSFLRVAH